MSMEVVMERDESQSLEHVLISYKHRQCRKKQRAEADSVFKAVFLMQGHMRIKMYSMTDFVLRLMFY